MPKLVAAVASSLVLGACASTSPKDAFHDTASLVEARSGHHIAWNQAGAADSAVGDQVRALLARGLTADAAVEVALLYNKSLQATFEELSVAQADLVQAGLLQNPVFGAGIAFPVAGNAQTGVGLSVSQDFLGVFLLAAKKKIAAAELRAARFRVADAVLRSAQEVEQAYFELVSAQQIAAMRRAVLEAGDAAVELARRQHDAGNVSDLDLVNQETLYEQVRVDLARSEAGALAARERLTRLLGLSGNGGPVRVAARLPELPATEAGAERIEAVALERRVDLLGAHEEVETLARSVSLAKGARWIGGATVGATYDKDPEGFSAAGPNLGVEVPIFDQKQAIIARLEGRLRAARNREAAMIIDIRSEVRSAQGRVAATRAIVERYTEVVVPLRERSVALTRQQYDAMFVGAYQLLLAKQNELAAYREAIEALRDYWIARSDLERATGGAVALSPPPVAPHTPLASPANTHDAAPPGAKP